MSKNSKIPISPHLRHFNDKHTRARSEREREKDNTKTKSTKHGERQQEESEKESAKSSIGGVRICDDDDSNNKTASERFLQRENGSFPFETDSFTVAGTSGVAGKTPIIPHADEE